MLKHIIVLALCFMAYIIGNLGEVYPADRKAQFDRLVDCYDQMFQHGFVTGARPELTTFQDITNFVYTDIRVKTTEGENGKTVTDVNSPQFSNYLQLELLKRVFAEKFVPKGPQDIMKILEPIRENHKLKTIEHSDDAPETSVNNKKRKLNTIIPSVDAPEVSVDNRRFEDDESFGIVKNLFTNQFTESWSPEELKKKLDDMISVHKIDVVFNYPLGVFAYNYAHKSPQEMLRSVAAYCNAYSIFIEAVN